MMSPYLFLRTGLPDPAIRSVWLYDRTVTKTTHRISVCTLTNVYKYATPYLVLFASNLPFQRTPLLSPSRLVGSSSEVADVCFLHESHQMSCPLSRREGERKGGWERNLSSLMPRLVQKVWEWDENWSNLDMTSLPHLGGGSHLLTLSTLISAVWLW